jgi:hypothetical protein
MNDMKTLEKQLESWTPRRPSPKLQRRLFPAVKGARAHSVPLAALWLPVAAGACVFLMTAWLALPRRAHSSVMVASSGSNLIAGLSVPDRSCQMNLWQTVTFDWTKAGSSLSITGRFGLGRTNL